MKTNNWTATYYDNKGEVIITENFKDRTEHEANNEAMALMPDDCEDWSLMPKHTDNVGGKLEDKFIIKHIKDNAEVRVLFNPENTTAKEIVSSLNNHYALVEALTNMVAFYEGDANLAYIDKAKELLNNINKSK